MKRFFDSKLCIENVNVWHDLLRTAPQPQCRVPHRDRHRDRSQGGQAGCCAVAVRCGGRGGNDSHAVRPPDSREGGTRGAGQLTAFCIRIRVG